MDNVKQVVCIKLFLKLGNEEVFVPFEEEPINRQVLKSICRARETFGQSRAPYNHIVVNIEDLIQPDENSHHVLIHRGPYAGQVCMLDSEGETGYGLVDSTGMFFCVPKDSAKALPYFDEIKEQWEYVSS